MQHSKNINAAIMLTQLRNMLTTEEKRALMDKIIKDIENK